MMERWYIRQVQLPSLPRGSYTAKLPAVQDLHRRGALSFAQPVTFLTGENGSGKSTLLEAIARCAGYNAEGGSKNFRFSTRETTSNLAEHLRLVRSAYEKDGFFLRAESLYNLATQVDELDLNPEGYGGRSLHAQSHGESIRSLVCSRFRGQGLYLLDEPEAGLSPTAQMALLYEMHRLCRADSQFIIATHSPVLLAYPGAVIYALSDEGIRETTYRESEPYRLTRQFLNDPEGMLRRLLEE